MQTKREALHRLIKSTYLSTEKFAASLANVTPSGIQEKISALYQYIKKKEAECKALELEIDKEALLEEQKEENEVVLQMVDFLGRQGLVGTIEKISEELHLGSLISVEPYISAKESIKKAMVENISDIVVCTDPASKLTCSTHVMWKFADLCVQSKEEAILFCKKHRESLPSKYLPLLVLPSRSGLFQKLADECSNKKLGSFLAAEVSKINMNGKECMLYKRSTLGVSGFTTPACKEKEESTCPGCASQTSKLSKGIPKSMRSSTRILCTKTKQLIPEDSPIFANTAGEVFCSLSLPSDALDSDASQFKKAYRRCYFV
ncbi:macrophage erythroblast attacher [Nematocida sp. AWRm77]|nr:macrophage erythroblast attacher [Nematocida sp. AWRm77]